MNPIMLVSQVSSLANSVSSVANALSSTTKTQDSFSKEMTDALSRFMKDHDTNKDGKLTLSEFGGNKQAFDKLDLNHDGKLSTNELKPMFGNNA